MNKRQLRSMWVIIVIVVLMCLFPPSNHGYNFITDHGGYKYTLFTAQLAIQIFAVSVVGVGLHVSLRTKSPKEREEEGLGKP